MQLAITAIAVIAGMVFSLAVALLVEEFIFGEVFSCSLPDKWFGWKQNRSGSEGESLCCF
jgi:hypothetical protein